MSDAAAVCAFIDKWDAVTVNERAVAQSHFNDVCTLLGVKPPLEADPKGTFFRFEKPLSKSGGGKGFADVWYKDRFAWEYKTKGKYPDLRAAYQQLTLYRADLDNPPILVACDIANYEVHVEFTGYTSRVVAFKNADLQNAETRALLRLVLTAPEQLRPVEQQATITEKAAAQLARVAGFLEKRGFPPFHVAHFFMKILFVLFAEDIKLLPGELMSQGIKKAIFKPEEFVGRTRALFRAMKVGDYFGEERVPQFNGWLFDDEDILPLNADELQFLSEAAKLDWSQVDPSIFGTLFERSLDPSKRAQLGAHYTSKNDILLIVEPVLMQPLRREWDEVQVGVEALRSQWQAESVSANRQRQLKGVAEGMLLEFMERLSKVRVLDPACGSGNFLYVALTELKNLEREVWSYAGGLGLPQPALSISPTQLFGIEKNAFAAELAQVVVWIGYLQWNQANGVFNVQEPVLQSLHNIECRDAILTVDLNGNPAEPPWPEADVIVGNPPFLGDKKMRGELGDTYVDNLRKLYTERLPAQNDVVCYWFEKARAQIAVGKSRRAGLLATQAIRGGPNRRVLDRIKSTCDIFMAWEDRNWFLNGAAVHVSMVGFGENPDKVFILNGQAASSINSDLTSSTDLTVVKRLQENLNISYRGDTKGGDFDVPSSLAEGMLKAPLNSKGKQNSIVVKPWVNGLDITRHPRGMWIIDFGVDMPEQEAAVYELPFDYILRNVKPMRLTVRRKTYRDNWWIHMEPRPAMRAAIAPLERYIVTLLVAKHRIFTWLKHPTLPDQQLIVIARDDDYFFGVLHSSIHELWVRSRGTQLREAESGHRYTQASVFETFPFPWPPGKEPQDDLKLQAIAEAARELVRLRDEWLNPAEVIGINLKERTLTNLYNKRPDWLDEAHRRLDAAVFGAYGWPHDLTDDEILARLLALNLERAAGQGQMVTAAAEGEADIE